MIPSILVYETIGAIVNGLLVPLAESYQYGLGQARKNLAYPPDLLETDSVGGFEGPCSSSPDVKDRDGGYPTHLNR